jgi:hypothetical protein
MSLEGRTGGAVLERASDGFSEVWNLSGGLSSRRRLHLAKPSGTGESVSAISFASAAPSKIRRRAEFELYLRANTASNPSSTSWRLVRSTVAMLVSSAAAIRLLADPMNAEPYRRNADDAHRRASNAEPQIRALWLRLADSWLRLLSSDEKPYQSHLSKVVWPPGRPDDSQSCISFSNSRSSRRGDS